MDYLEDQLQLLTENFAKDENVSAKKKRMKSFVSSQLVTSPAITKHIAFFNDILENPGYDKHLKQATAGIIGRVGPVAKDLAPTIVKSMTEIDSNEYQMFAAMALESIGAKDKRAVKILTKHLNSDDKRLRRTSAIALLGFGEANELAIQVLNEGLTQLDVILALGRHASLLKSEARKKLNQSFENLPAEDRAKYQAACRYASARLSNPSVDISGFLQAGLDARSTILHAEFDRANRISHRAIPPKPKENEP